MQVISNNELYVIASSIESCKSLNGFYGKIEIDIENGHIKPKGISIRQTFDIEGIKKEIQKKP